MIRIKAVVTEMNGRDKIKIYLGTSDSQVLIIKDDTGFF
jgi:hypothetical protein